jgi:hypothetical protein
LASKPANAAVHLTAVRFLVLSLGDAGTAGGFSGSHLPEKLFENRRIACKRPQDHGLPSSCP